jgi:hypothetical protein
VKMCEEFVPNFGNKRTVCCITTTHRFTHPLFIREFLAKSNMTMVLHPPYFSVSQTEDETERLPFWHNCGDQGRIAGCTEHPHRTRLLGFI